MAAKRYLIEATRGVAVLAVLDAQQVAAFERGDADAAREIGAARVAVAELHRVSIFVSGRIFRWRTEGSAPSYREWMETEEMLDAALARVGGAA